MRVSLLPSSTRLGFASRASAHFSASYQSFKLLHSTSVGRVGDRAVIGASQSHQVSVFNRKHKANQRDRAASLPNAERFDYLRATVGERLCDRLHDLLGRQFPTVIEVGSGTGPVVQHLQDEKFAVERIFKVDSSELMLRRDEANDPSLRVAPARIHADEEALPFQPGTADLIISNMGMHWINDLPGFLVQVMKTLKPDGLFLASMLGEDTLFELRASMQLADTEREGGVGVHVSPMARVADIGNLLTRYKFALPTVDQETLVIKYSDMFGLLTDLRAMGESNSIRLRRSRLPLDNLFASAAAYEAIFGDPEDNTVPATFQVIYMIGWSPHPSQRKPVKRGSQEVSLKELGSVVGTLEETN